MTRTDTRRNRTIRLTPAGRRYLANRPRKLISPSQLTHRMWRIKAYRDLLGRGMDNEQARRVIACCEGLAKGAAK